MYIAYASSYSFFSTCKLIMIFIIVLFSCCFDLFVRVSLFSVVVLILYTYTCSK